MKKIALGSAVLAVGTLSGLAVAGPTYVAVGAYDENLVAANTVDVAAASSNRTLLQVQADATAAVAAGTGGVINFDNPVNAATPFDNNIVATYNGGANTITFAVSSPAAVATVNNANTQTGSIISGTAGLGFTADSNFNLVPSVGLTEFAITEGSRGADRAGIFTFVLSSGSTVFTAEVVSAANDDTLFSYLAPTGSTITQIQYRSLAGGLATGAPTVSPDTGQFARFDDLLFVTAAGPAVPEPASLGLLGLGAVAMLRRRRA